MSKREVPYHSDRYAQENGHEYKNVHGDREKVSWLVYLGVDVQNLPIAFKKIHHSGAEEGEGGYVPGLVLKVRGLDLDSIDLLSRF